MTAALHHRCSSDPALLWLWCRLAATSPMGPLAWETSICCRNGPKQTNKQKSKNKTNQQQQKKENKMEFPVLKAPWAPVPGTSS